jgi:hypothetical protein
VSKYISVADPGCLSQILDPDFFTRPGSLIPDLRSRIQKQQQKRGVKKICCHIFFCRQKFPKLNYFIFEMPRKKVWASFLTINVPVVFMARYVMVLRGATSLRGALEGVGAENRDFFGP